MNEFDEPIRYAMPLGLEGVQQRRQGARLALDPVGTEKQEAEPAKRGRVIPRGLPTKKRK